MLAYANAKALELTLETGEMHFFSRSRDEIWRKGETSGSTMAVKQLRYDCDGDAVLAIVAPAGPACHTGERTCFYREIGGAAVPAKDAPPAPGEPHRVVHEALPALQRTLESRARRAPRGQLHGRAARQPDPDRRKGARRRPRRSSAPPARRPTSGSPKRPPTCSTTCAVLLAARNVPPAAVFEVLNGRAG